MVWISDLRHFLDENGAIPAEIPGPARNVALYLGSIVAWVTDHRCDDPYDDDAWTNVPCRPRPGRRRCNGLIWAWLDSDGSTICWECMECGDNGTIVGWERTRWDRRRGSDGEIAVESRED